MMILTVSEVGETPPRTPRSTAELADKPNVIVRSVETNDTHVGSNLVGRPARRETEQSDTRVDG